MLPTDQSQGRACNLAGMYPVCPDRLLAPDVFLLERRGLREFLRQRKDQRHHMLGDHRAVYFPRIGDHHVAVHKFVKQQLMHRRCGCVNPTQVSRCRKLFGAQRDREDDFRLAQISLDAVIAGALRDLQLRKLL